MILDYLTTLFKGHVITYCKW